MRSIEQRSDGQYEILSDDPRDVPAGPYRTKAEAQEDCRGLTRFDKAFARQFPALACLAAIIAEDEIEAGMLF